jgi:hypothetical protein
MPKNGERRPDDPTDEKEGRDASTPVPMVVAPMQGAGQRLRPQPLKKNYILQANLPCSLIIRSGLPEAIT